MTPSGPAARNWAGNVAFARAELVAPSSTAELRDVVARAPRVRALGTGHSFSRVADTDGVLVSTAALPVEIDVDAAAGTVRTTGWTRWGELAPAVHRHGFALHNMGSLPHISVAGSAATGTHGSGSALGCLATAVSGIELVTADGSVVELRRGDPGFDGAVVSLGSLGIVTAVDLDLVPAYEIEQTVWEGARWDAVLEGLDSLMAAARSVSLFTGWTGEAVEQVWVKRDTADPDVDLGWTGAHRARTPLHPVPGGDPAACTEQLGAPGPWFERVPHFRLDHTPSSGNELQTEYMVAREHGAEVLAAVRRLADVVSPVLQVSEIRTVAGDDLWLSPCYGRDTVAIHFTWVSDAEAVAPAVLAVEEALAPFDARPHWGKVFSVPAEQVRALYPRADEFARLRDRLDPGRRFAGDFVDRYLGA